VGYEMIAKPIKERRGQETIEQRHQNRFKLDTASYAYENKTKRKREPN